MINAPRLDFTGNRKLILNTAPTSEPVDLDEFKEWARIDGTYEDTTLSAIITSARKKIEQFTHRSLLTQTWDLFMDFWPTHQIKLPYSPVQSITSVVTLDEDDAATTYSSGNYFLLGESPSVLVIKQSTSPPVNTDRSYGGYRIRYIAGYGDDDTDVPQALRDALMVWATHIYENRDPNPNPPAVVKEIIGEYVIPEL